MLHQLRLKTTKYGSITLTNLQNQLAYVWDALGRSVFIVLIMFIFVQLWTAVYQTRPTDEIAGLTLSATIWYFLIAEVIELGKFRHDQRISEEVKEGTIAYALIRPYHYLIYHFCNGLGETVVKMALIFLLGLPVVLVYAGPPTTAPATLPAVILVGFLALILDFCMASSIGLLAFVTEDTFSFRLIYQKLIFILGGLLIPLDFLPAGMQQVARILPFSYTTYAPAKLFVDFTSEQFWQTVGMQFLWIGIMGGLLLLQYHWAVRRLEVNGG